MESLSDYDFILPEELIAQQPLQPRDSSRLLVIDRARGTWSHHVFRELPEILDADDFLVVNNTRVIKARLLGHRLLEPGEPSDRLLGGKIEFVMLEQLGLPPSHEWEGLFHASAKYKRGLRFSIPTPDGLGLQGELIRASFESEHGTVVARFDRDPLQSGAGELPLPKYIRRKSEEKDDIAYQTLYGSKPGSAAAPTAGLHFTTELMGKLQARGIGWEEVTLNVGLGTFRPVKHDDISRHLMHEERYEIQEGSASRINAAKSQGRRIVAVGTTSVRTLESSWSGGMDGSVRPGAGATALFIRPGQHKFNMVDRMITNFHLPKSTLLMLVSAFAGRELIQAAYREAVRKKYRFFSYGDAMLIL